MMKKFILMLLVFLPAMAFGQHLAFMNIPLTGTIDAFGVKLKQKGFAVSPYSKTLPVGSREFMGTFFGKKSDVFVYYDPKTKLVYRAKATIDVKDRDDVVRLFNEVRQSLLDKYADKSMYLDDTYNGYDSTSLVIVRRIPQDDEELEPIGRIDVYISEFDYEGYWLSIDYVDSMNSQKFDASKSRDL